MTVTLPTDILSCRLSCLGAEPVQLPGSVGIGKGASVTDVSLDGCRRACLAAGDCEAVVFTNQTKDVPFKSMCFGRRSVRTSLCQPGGRFITEVLTGRPWGKCAIFGDPHMLSFDRVYGPPVTVIDPGDFRLIESERLTVQGRFGYTHRFPTASSTLGVAIGGALIKGHSLVVQFVGPEEGARGFMVFWDGKRILADYPSSFTSEDKVLRAKHDAMDPSKFHREGRHTIGGTNGLLPSYLFNLKPDIDLYVLIGPDNCNAVIATRKMEGPQDGYCGNYNCDQADDGLEALQRRGVASPLPDSQSLFVKHGRPAPAWTMRKVAPPSLEDCDPDVKERAQEECKHLPTGERPACIFDACASNDAAAAKEDVGILALPYDCGADSPARWSAKQQAWCCEKEHVGCRGNANSTVRACDRECTFAGHTATCKARVYWAATHRFAGHVGACASAHKFVLEHCQSTCAGCSLADSSCDGKEPHVGFFKRFEDRPVREAAARGSGLSRVLVAGLCVGCASIASLVVAARFGARGAARLHEFSQHIAGRSLLPSSEEPADVVE